MRRPGVVAVKSVAAYRTGFDLDPARPSEAEVTTAARDWLARGGRLEDPVLVRELLWTAVDLGLPLQLHTGFGDNDIRLHRTDPALLTDWLHAISGTIPVLLLHCWPYQRQAGYLAAVFENVYLDVGLTLHHVGPVRARAVLAEASEITPFRKLLYSSDAYGLAEFYGLGRWRSAGDWGSSPGTGGRRRTGPARRAPNGTLGRGRQCPPGLPALRRTLKV